MKQKVVTKTMKEDALDILSRIFIGFVVLFVIVTIIVGSKAFYERHVELAKLNKAICHVNGEDIEIRIKEIKNMNGEYLITDDKGAKWQLSSKVCTFVE